MAAVARLSIVLIDCPNRNPAVKSLGFSFHSHRYAASDTLRCRKSRGWSSAVTCSASNGPSSPDISSTAKIRSEVLSPFRSLRMFFYLAFVASGSLGGLIALSQLIEALSNPSRAAQVSEILNGLGIDLGAVSIFAFLYYRDNNAKNAQLARLSREESLSSLKLRVDEKRILPLSAFRGIARLVILAGPTSFIEESFRLSEPFSAGLVERGVLVVPLATDGNLPDFEIQETGEIDVKRKRLWQLTPVLAPEWNKWLDEQKKLANVSPESPRDDNFWICATIVGLIGDWYYLSRQVSIGFGSRSGQVYCSACDEKAESGTFSYQIQFDVVSSPRVRLCFVGTIIVRH